MTKATPRSHLLIAAMDPSEDTAVQDFLEILEEHRKNCERQGKYVEAEIAKNRLDELKLHEENRRRVWLFDLVVHLDSSLSTFCCM
jgi:hypothetical protein